MICTNITDQVPFLWPEPEYRPAGVHLSDIIKLMREEYLGQVYPDDADLEPDELEAVKMKRNRGFMWERICETAYSGMVLPRGKPFLFRGIWVSPDGVGIRREGERIEVDEIKFTDSFKTPIDQAPWKWQHATYCLASGATGGRFYVCHNFGISRGGERPLPQVYHVEYGDMELEENFEQITNFAKAKGMI